MCFRADFAEHLMPSAGAGVVRDSVDARRAITLDQDRRSAQSLAKWFFGRPKTGRRADRDVFSTGAPHRPVPRMLEETTTPAWVWESTVVVHASNSLSPLHLWA
jgi:hypothetical protein